MSPAILGDVPQELLGRLHLQGDEPAVQSTDREAALTWLRGVLVDFTLLSKHISALQRLYGAPFRHPRARRDGGPDGAAPEARFRFRDGWSDERLIPVLDNGVGGLGDGELGELLLNPYALSDLHDAIAELHPDAWLPVMLDVGREAVRREAQGPTALPVAPKTQLAPTRGPSGPGWWRALALAACAAGLLIGGVGIGVTWRGPVPTDPKGQGGGDAPALFQLNNSSRPANWGDIWEDCFDKDSSPTENLNRIRAAVGPELKAIIDDMRKQNIADYRILTHLQEKYSSKE